MIFNSLLNKTPPSKLLDLVDNIVSVAINLLIFIIAVISTLYISYIPFDIDGSSMEPTLYDGNIVLISKFNSPSRKDIVVIDTGGEIINEKGGKSKHYIVKRVVAVEGEKVAFLEENGTVYLYIDGGNGFVKQTENYILEPMKNAGNSVFYKISVCTNKEELDQNCIVVPSNSVFALGDNRNISSDSRKYGCFEITSVCGTMVNHFEKESFLGKIFNFLFKRNTVNI